MNYFCNIYQKTLAENEKNILFWEDYLQNLESLDLNLFAESLKVPALVPVGSRILFRGELVHTNEITVSLGADYFAKCSLKQAEVLRQHRIKDAQTKLATYKNEREYIENQLSFTKNNILQDNGQEIIEIYTAEEDKAWREKHRENVRLYKRKNVEQKNKETEITDDELWNRLDELELQEELDTERLQQYKVTERTELVTDRTEPVTERKELVTDRTEPVTEKTELVTDRPEPVTEKTELATDKTEPVIERTQSVTESFMVLERPEKKVKFMEEKQTLTVPEINEKIEVLQKIWEKQNELEAKIMELKMKNRRQTKSEGDLITRLNEMEALDDLEDEMNRLDDLIENEDIDSDESIGSNRTHVVQRNVSFVDKDESETLQLSFSHSDTEPCREPYDSQRGLQKPSDIYEAHSNLFNEITSILKKSKYHSVPIEKKQRKVAFQVDENEGSYEINRTIVVNDVVEKVDRKKVELSSARPTSLFKKKRQEQMNSSS